MVQAIMKNPQPTEVANPGELAKWKDSPFNQQKMTIVLKNYQRLSVCVCVFSALKEGLEFVNTLDVSEHCLKWSHENGDIAWFAAYSLCFVGCLPDINQ